MTRSKRGPRRDGLAATPRAIPASPSHSNNDDADADEENPTTTSSATPLLSSTWTAGEGVRRTSTSSRKKWERHTAGGLCVSRVSMRSGGSGDGGGGGGGEGEGVDEGGDGAALLERRQDRGSGILAAALGAVAAGLSSRPQSDDDGDGLRSPLLADGAASDAESGRATSRLAVASSSTSAPPAAPAPAPRALVPKKRGVSVAAAGGAAAPAAASDAARSTSPPAADDDESDAEADSAKASAAVALSLVCNVLLLLAKAAAFFFSGSEAVLASMVDSVIDLVSQLVLAAAERASASRHERFPVGRARMSAVGVASAAGIMLGATLLVVQASALDLFRGFFRGQLPDLVLSPLLYSILSGAIVVKAGLFLACAAAASRAPPGRGDALRALAEDHRTDVAANAAALLAGLVARRAWWADPSVAILLSFYIALVWARVFRQQVEQIVGKGADAETMSRLERVASAHDADRVSVDVIRAWHAGERIFVEVEVVMDPDTPLRESHDAGLALQVKLERIPLVERAFVHVDYVRRAEPEHALDRALSGLPPIEESGVAGAADAGVDAVANAV